MNRIFTTRLILVIAAAIVFASCSDDDGGIVVPPTPQQELHFLRDTFYASPYDSIVVGAYVAGLPATQELTLLFGDGQRITGPAVVNDTLALTHQYLHTGTYEAYLLTGDEEVDTCIIVVQEYLRPSHTSSISVEIRGIQRGVEHTLKTFTPPVIDSVWGEIAVDFTMWQPFTEPEYRRDPGIWNNSQQCSWKFRSYPSSNFFEHYDYEGTVTLSPDGKRVGSLSLHFLHHQGWEGYQNDESAAVEIHDIGLSTESEPFIGSATYTGTFDASEFDRKVRNIEASRLTIEQNAQSGWASKNIILTGPVTVTVRFNY